MPRKAYILIVLVMMAALRPTGNPGNRWNSLLSAFRRADQFFNAETPTAKTDSLALAGFNQLIAAIGDDRVRPVDSLLYESLFRKGILHDVQLSPAQAKQAYLRALTVGQNTGRFPDSLFFRLYVYVGTDYYSLNQYDSASYFLSKAELLADSYRNIAERERLYNSLGALHFDNGNYLQSRTYFSQALSVVERRKPLDEMLIADLKTNIASSYYKMGRYREALSMYEEIVQQARGPVYDGVYMNMGKVQKALGDYKTALATFHRINAAKSPGVYNELAQLFYERGQLDSCAVYLEKLKHWPGQLNALDRGINAMYAAELLLQREQYLSAIQSLQAAIVNFSSDFKSADIYQNPQAFSGSYTYFRLFEAIHKKGLAFEQLYRARPTEKYLEAALDAYMAALRLLSFIEKSYDTDDAKFFLKKNSRAVYDEALAIALRLNIHLPNAGFLATAFSIAERNKASVLAAGLRVRSIVQQEGADPALLQKEKNIKYNIARLNIRSEQAQTTADMEQLAREKAEYEIALSQLQKSMDRDDNFHRLKYADSVSNLPALQSAIDRDEVVFNFFLANNMIHVFAVSKTALQYQRIDDADSVLAAISGWSNELQNTGDGRRFDGSQYSRFLYSHLVKPMLQLGGDADKWTIIPDGKIWLLPFESLPADDGNSYLVEKKTIGYQFSSRFILPGNTDTHRQYRVLSFAPFVKAAGGFAALSGSTTELSSVDGVRYIGERAQKGAFLQALSAYPVVHLATHAIADPANASASYIAFYPDTGVPVEDNLFLEEIYALDMRQCQLVIVSACETGKGALVSNEGVISLGRAFAAAGCSSTINSLWKADDKATAFILSRFHQYISDGYTKTKALQRAKVDYLHSDAIYKNPAYWSHLVLIGNADALTQKAPSWLETVLLLDCLLVLIALGSLAVRREWFRKKVDASLVSYTSETVK
ncbi:MAG TPA: CHAT domain-containing protein [Flavihumibacter sp.]|nr:CHAT domain-containing protein [Flavihumibacter sp.]